MVHDVGPVCTDVRTTALIPFSKLSPFPTD